MSSLFVPDSVARNEAGISDAERSAQFAANAAQAKRRERRAQWHLLFILVCVLGPLVVYPLARLVISRHLSHGHNRWQACLRGRRTPLPASHAGAQPTRGGWRHSAGASLVLSCTM